VSFLKDIRLKRQEKGLSQIALAARLGVERKWIIRLEAGNSKAELGLILKALDALGLQAFLRSNESLPADKSGTPSPSRLDEVFQHGRSASERAADPHRRRARRRGPGQQVLVLPRRVSQ
jgi:HTH-type transcriptional regulator/antitoxin HipB